MRDLRQGNFEGEVNNVELDKENAQGSNMNTIESSRFITHRKRNAMNYLTVSSIFCVWD